MSATWPASASDEGIAMRWPQSFAAIMHCFDVPFAWWRAATPALTITISRRKNRLFNGWRNADACRRHAVIETVK